MKGLGDLYTHSRLTNEDMEVKQERGAHNREERDCARRPAEGEEDDASK
jgi:hypothetical protein